MTSGYDEYCRNLSAGLCIMCGRVDSIKINGHREYCLACAMKSHQYEIESLERQLSDTRASLARLKGTP